MDRVVSWFSTGVSSFIAAYLERENIDNIIYTHIENQHPDTMRFLKDCEIALSREIEILISPYLSVDNVIEQFRFINSRYGAKCTEILKKRVRKEWEDKHKGEDIMYIWGYDIEETSRAERLLEVMPQYEHRFPLIERGLSKEDCHGMLKELNIKRPIMYDLGYRNNNCVGCVKGGMGYWNKIRVDFPEVFERRARQEREIGKTCLTEKRNGDTIQLYLDELEPTRGRIENEIMEDCNITCQLNL